jgi:hypothetical protein
MIRPPASVTGNEENLPTRNDQDGRQPSERRSQRPVAGGDQVRGPAERGGRGLVLRDRAGAQAEQGALVEQMQEQGRDERDADQPHAVLGDGRSGDREQLGGQLARYQLQAVAVSLDGDRGEHDEDRQGADQTGQ